MTRAPSAPSTATFLASQNPQQRQKIVQALGTTRVSASDLDSGSVQAIAAGTRSDVTPGNISQLKTNRATFLIRTAPAPMPLKTNAAVEKSLGGASLYKLDFDVSAPVAASDAYARATPVLVVQPLRFDGKKDRFVGTVHVALKPSQGAQDAAGELLHPVSLALGTDSAAWFDPDVINLASVGDWSAPIQVTVAVPERSVSRIEVFVQPGGWEQPSRFPMPLARPSIELGYGRNAIEGWGLGSTRVLVRVHGMDEPANYQLNLQSSAGELDPELVRLDEGGTAVATLRSSSIDGTRITVDSQAFAAPASVTIRYLWPWSLLAAALLGGVLGTVLRHKGHRGWWNNLPIGMLSGAFLCAGYAVGVNLLPQLLPQPGRGGIGNQALFFFVGACGALIGIQVKLLISGRLPHTHEPQQGGT